MAEDTHTERVRREVELFNQIHECKRGGKENKPEYDTMFNGTVASYVNQIGMLRVQDNLQFAIMMLRKANQSSERMNAVTFQLMTQLRMTESPTARTEVDKGVLNALLQQITMLINKTNDGSEDGNGRYKISQKAANIMTTCIENLRKTKEQVISHEQNYFSIKDTA